MNTSDVLSTLYSLSLDQLLRMKCDCDGLSQSDNLPFFIHTMSITEHITSAEKINLSPLQEKIFKEIIDYEYIKNKFGASIIPAFENLRFLKWLYTQYPILKTEDRVIINGKVVDTKDLTVKGLYNPNLLMNGCMFITLEENGNLLLSVYDQLPTVALQPYCTTSYDHAKLHIRPVVD